MLEDPWNEPPDDIYTLTKSPADAPAAAGLRRDRMAGWRADGGQWRGDVRSSKLIDSLETIAGVHGVGRIDMVENRLVGIKSREIYEAPAAVLLHQAHRELEGFVIPKDLQRLKQRLSQEYADLVYNGLWFSPTRSAIDAFVQNIQPRVTGTIRLKLYKGNCRVVGRKSPFALYDHGLATYDEGRHVRSLRRGRLHQDLGASRGDGGEERAPTRREEHRSFSGAGGEVADGESLVRTFQRRARSRCLRVRVFLSVRSGVSSKTT